VRQVFRPLENIPENGHLFIALANQRISLAPRFAPHEFATQSLQCAVPWLPPDLPWCQIDEESYQIRYGDGMCTTVTFDDELYAKALDMADPDIDRADLFREAIKRSWTGKLRNDLISISWVYRRWAGGGGTSLSRHGVRW